MNKCEKRKCHRAGDFYISSGASLTNEKISIICLDCGTEASGDVVWEEIDKIK